MVTVLTIVLWTSLAGVCYSYAGYPLLIFASARIARRWAANAGQPVLFNVEPTETELPNVTVLIAAYNAGEQIRQRIQNLLDCDYPAERLQILIASDGSSDDTVRLVCEFGQANVSVVPFEQRRGKTCTLVAAVENVSSEVIVLTDASTQFETMAIRRLAKHFVDPAIGIVAGKVAILDELGCESESLYWRSEMMVRLAEAELGLVLGVSGAIYAMRRKLFGAPQRPTINDDMVLPMLAHLNHRCKFVLDESALAYAVSSGGLRTEFRRRCRIGAGGFQSLSVLSGLLSVQHIYQAAAFVSHKLLRWMCPFLLILILACNVGLLVMPGYQRLLWIQGTAYLLAVIGLFAPNCGPIARFARTASSFLVMNLAILTGFFQWLVDANQVVWNPTPRPTSLPVLGTRPAQE
ncbi:MAG: glycosyltransferase family 2 protein [Pirellulaceae bacterium]|nr:glycosyltransferase family 2 protein [Pirellulaceae bacterium]